MNVLEVTNVSKSFVDNQVINDFNLTLKAGKSTVIVGKSGTGKTTLVKIISGIIKPDTGAVGLLGKSINNNSTAAGSIGYVPQSPSLLQSMKVRENVLLPLKIASKHVDVSTVAQMIRLLRLEGFEGYYPYQLSRGQQQRVSLARGLVLNPKVLVLDEPFASVDEIAKEELNLELLRLKATLKLSFILVTHSIEEAVFLADEIIVLSDDGSYKKIKIDFGKKSRTVELKNTKKFFEYQSMIRRML